MSRYFILIFTLFMVLSCSNELEINNKNSKLNSGNQDVINSKVTGFDFKFSEGLNISSKSIIESGEPHFFYIFSPTWATCISELQEFTPIANNIPNASFYAISIDPTMSQSDIKSFKLRHKLNNVIILSFNKEVILYFNIRERGSKRIFNSKAELVYSGGHNDYEINLWEKLLNEKNN